MRHASDCVCVCACRTERVTSSQKDLIDYFSHNTGPLTIPGGCESVAFLALDGNPSGWPDLELLFVSGSLTSDVTLKEGFGLDRKLYQQVSKAIKKKLHEAKLPFKIWGEKSQCPVEHVSSYFPLGESERDWRENGWGGTIPLSSHCPRPTSGAGAS